jgi:chromosome segregation ATPase
MEFDELLITTGVDALVRLVKEKQRIELQDASSMLSIPQETIEDWSRVLEEEGILRIEYRLTRIYLVWVKPTEEEVATEKASFYEEKKGLDSEIEEVKQKIGSETAELAGLQGSFAEFYAKAYSKIDQLEKSVSPVPAGKVISEDILSKFRDELSDMDAKLEDVKRGAGEVRHELEALGLGREKGPSDELMERVERLSADLIGMQQELETLRKRAAAEAGGEEVSMPTVKDIRKKFETLQRDFSSLKSRNAQIRQDMISLHESSEILKSVAESIMGQEDKIGSLRNEVSALSAESEKLIARVNEINSKVKQNVEIVERLGDSVDVAKGVLKKFPSQDKVLEELDKLNREEEAIAEKYQAMEKLLEAVGGKQVTAKQFGELAKRMDEKAFQLRKDMDALEAALQDEKSTYLTFQKIKERIVPSLESYQQQLDGMASRIQKIREESSGQIEGIRAEAQKLQEAMKGGQMEDVMKFATEIREKKKTLDEIRTSLEDLVTLSENLTKRVTLLSREAKLLEIRTGGLGAGATTEGAGEGGGVAGVPAAVEKGLRTQLELTREEELEFRRKRDELKKLIQRLWEE